MRTSKLKNAQFHTSSTFIMAHLTNHTSNRLSLSLPNPRRRYRSSDDTFSLWWTYDNRLSMQISAFLLCILITTCAITNPVCQGKRYMCQTVESTEQSMTCVNIVDPLLKMHEVHVCPTGYVCNYDRSYDSLSNMTFSCV